MCPGRPCFQPRRPAELNSTIAATATGVHGDGDPSARRGEAMRRPIRVVGVGMLLALGLFAASCGGGDDSDQSTAATSDQGVKSGAQSQLGGEATSSTSG